MVKKMSKSLVISYILSFILLLIFALIMYYGEISDRTVGIMVVITYFISTLIGGIGIGKSVDNKKFIWGLIEGVIYFLLIFGISLIGEGGKSNLSSSIFVGLIISSVGGMIGGMISWKIT